MWLIDLILNLAGLLLWLKWLERDMSSVIAQPRVSLVANLRRATPRYPRLIFLGALLLLLAIRGFFYWLLGSAVDWVPSLHFGPIPLFFRSHFLGRTLLFSFLSFGQALAIFYCSLLLLSIVNRRLEDDPVQKLVRSQLGWLESWPITLKVLLPWLLAIILWCALNPLFLKIGIISPSQSFLKLFQQGIVLGLGIYLVWKYVVIIVLTLHVLNNYIYFGEWPVWSFIERSGKQMLKPLARLPLRLGKIDFAPVVAIVLVLLVAELGTRKLLEHWTGQKVQTIERLRR